MVGLTQSAPQVNQQGVVSRVMGQLQPTIARTVAQLLGGAGSQTQTLGFGTANVGSSFGQGSSRFTGGSSSFGQGSSSSFGQESSSFSGGSRGVSSGLSASQLTSQVVTSLQPSIAAAVAEALRGRTTSTSVSSTISAEEQERINALQVCYQFFNVSDTNYISPSLQMLSTTLSTKLVIMISRPTFLKQNPEMEKLFRVLIVMLILQEHS